MRTVAGSFAEIDRVAASSPRMLVATDFDGTLCPIAHSPDAVAVPAIVSELLQRLVSAGIVVAIISGRALDDLKRRLPVPAVFAGNDGLDIAGLGLRFEHAGACELSPMLTEVGHALRQTIARWKGAFFEDKRLTAAVHYRNVEVREQVELVRAVRRCMSGYGTQFGMRIARKAVDIRPRVAWGPGSCLNWIRESLHLESCPCICIGDESMFPADTGHLNVRVGLTGTSFAGFRAADVLEVVALLAHMERSVQRCAVQAQPA